jgi:hypothetical protein
MKPTPDDNEASLLALKRLNWTRGRGDIIATRRFLDGRCEADRKGQYFTDTIKFRVDYEKRRVFALRSSRKF